MWLTKIFGDPNEKYIKRLAPMVEQINVLRDKYSSLDDKALKGLAEKWRGERAAGKKLDNLLPEVFAAVREAAKRRMGSGHFDVQMIGARVLHEGKIAEMKTGEGKTSYAVSPAATLNALEGKGVHIVTVNDYLSLRDAGWIGSVYSALGLSVGAIVHEKAYRYEPGFVNPEFDDERMQPLKPCTRREAYECDITYGTNNEFGFDYLRDNMAQELKDKVQRGWHYAIIDEVDSILIDEARTPLIISAPAAEATEKYQKFARLIPRLKEGEDYNIDEKMRAATLTEAGIKKMEEWLGVDNIYTQDKISEVHHMEQALRAYTLFHRDKDYVVKDGQVIIIDEFTGRLMPGRRYSEGLHQAIEAKEGVKIKQESVTMATITFQNYFRMYDKLAGMTGTAATEAEEFSKIYDLDVIVIPTNKPVIRKDRADLIYKNEQAKFKAVIEDVKQRQAKGQPVLIGTISIEKNELFSYLLNQAGVEHNVLNAKNHAKEAQIIAEAGKKGKVTLATNMAGRGVDIKLGGEGASREEYEEIKKLGGLYVIGTERHESRRIDNQLRGRAGRQGDPGESRFYVSLDDDLMRIFGSDRVRKIMQTLGMPDDMPIEHKMISKALESAQKKVEGYNFDIRKHLLEYDDVINKHREVIYKKREMILELYEALKDGQAKVEKTPDRPYGSLREMIMEMVEKEIAQVVSFHTQDHNEENWNMEEIYEVVGTIFPLDSEARIKMEDIQQQGKDKQAEAMVRDKIIAYLVKLAEKAYDNLEATLKKIDTGESSDAPAPILQVEKMILLRAIDMLWVEHIDAMDHLRTGIGLRGYGQKDPLVEYKREAYKMFIQLQNNIQKQVVYSIYKVGLVSPEANKLVVGEAQPVQDKNLQFKKDSVNSYELKGERVNSNQTVVSAKAGETSEQATKQAPLENKEKIGRNDPCPCGSGKKWKKCGLLNTEEHQRRMKGKL
jgi:preprotein translocase subunit SecA